MFIKTSTPEGMISDKWRLIEEDGVGLHLQFWNGASWETVRTFEPLA